MNKQTLKSVAESFTKISSPALFKSRCQIEHPAAGGVRRVRAAAGAEVSALIQSPVADGGGVQCFRQLHAWQLQETVGLRQRGAAQRRRSAPVRRRRGGEPLKALTLGDGADALLSMCLK